MPKPELDRDFLYWFLRQHRYEFITISKGGAQPNISQTLINRTEIPLPPIQEQKNIAGLLNEIEINKTVNGNLIDEEVRKDVETFLSIKGNSTQISTELDHQLALVKELRQAYLREAMQGKLVPQDSTDEPAEILLEMIKAEKEKLVAEKRIKRDKPLPPINPEELPFEIPSSWTWCRLATIALKTSTGPFGTMLHKSDYVVNGSIPMVNPANMVKGKIYPSDKMLVDEATKKRLRSYVLEAGDIVVARRGEMGRCAVVTDKENGWLCGSGSFFIKLATSINRDYFSLVFRSPYSRSYLKGFSVGSTMDNLNHRVMNSFPFPLPPLAEQERIVTKLEG